MARQQRGFTLVELGLAVAILSIVAAIAMPSFLSKHDNSLLSASASELLAALRFAHQQSIVSGKPHQVLVNANTYRVVDTSAGSAGEVVPHPVSKAPYIVNVPEGVSLQNAADGFIYQTMGGANTVTFSAIGQPHFKNGSNWYRLQSVSLVLRSGQLQKALMVSSISGRATLL